ncbi:MAG TPA: cyclic nucleotide-binding domain-containing protein [Planctomycetota bacterium]|nr:cyclic nucleotide-binding domain-containing protein [Planctomycetota bacterium]
MTPRSFLRDVDLFRDLPDGHLDRLAAVARPVTARRGETITRDTDPPDRLFAVMSGVVEVGRTARDGSFVRLARVERGEVFGALGSVGRSGTAVAAIVPETQLLAWDAAGLKKLMAEDPALGRSLLDALVARLSARLHSASEAVFTLLQAMGR